MSTYLAINLFTILVPLLLSFDKRVSFYKKFVWLLPAIGISAFLFIVWDHIFTVNGVWSFNPEHLVGVDIFDLPLEELLFFVTVPYACVFIYETLNEYWNKDLFKAASPYIFWGIVIALIALALIYNDRAYTMVNAWFAVAVCLLHFTWFRYEKFGFFMRAYLVSLIPFLIVNGILTYLPVVMYNNAENLGIRIVSIPVEDTVYAFSLLLLTISLFERFQLIGAKKKMTYGVAS